MENNRQDERPKPLEWHENKQIQHGFIVGTINSAERPDGSRIFSWCIGREGRGKREGQVVKFCDPRDFEDAHYVLDELKEWIDDEKAAARGS